MSLQLKQGSQLIVVEAGNGFKVYYPTVQKVTGPLAIKNEQGQPVQGYNVEATDGQQPFQFNELPADRNVHTYANGTIVADNIQSMAAEARRVRQQAQQTIASLPRLQEIEAGMGKVLEEIDPDYAEKKKMREELDAVREQNKQMMEEFKREMKALRDELKTSKSKEK